MQINERFAICANDVPGAIRLDCGKSVAFSLFLPTILRGKGHKRTRAQPLSVPPYASAAVLTIAVGWFADRTRWRGHWNMGIACLGITGFIMLIASPDVSNNIQGVYKRGVVIGIVVGWGNLNRIVSSNIFLSNESPRFWTGHGTILAVLSLCLLGGSVLMHTLLRIEDSKRPPGKRDGMHAGQSAVEIWVAGDNRPDSIYTI